MTKLSDFAGEINGFLTYDRKIIKVGVKAIKKANNLLKYCLWNNDLSLLIFIALIKLLLDLISL